jgi:uncharacterized protein (TIGR02391 family)
MPRLLLEIAGSAGNLLKMTQEELAWALLEDMQARLKSPINGMASRNIASGLLTASAVVTNPNLHGLAGSLNKAGQRAFKLLEKWDLAEPADGQNGVNGYIVLTEKGKSTNEPVDFERIRLRGLLKDEMLHHLLRGKVYGYFAADDLGTAVFEAFKLVEIEVRAAGGFADKDHGKDLVTKAFALGSGPLTMPGDDKRDCNALTGLFAGSLSRFRNPGAHTNRTYGDVLEAMEELMLASRLLRIVDSRRRP